MKDHDPVPPPASPAEPCGIKQRLRDLEAEYDPYDHALPLGRVHGTATIGEFVTIVRIALGTLLHGDDPATPPAPATDEDPLTPEELALLDKAWEVHKAAKPSEEHPQISDISRIPPMHEVYNFARSNPVTFAEIATELHATPPAPPATDEEVARAIVDAIDIDYGDWDGYGVPPKLGNKSEVIGAIISALARAHLAKHAGEPGHE